MNAAVAIRLTVVLAVCGALAWFWLTPSTVADDSDGFRIDFNQELGQWSEADLLTGLSGITLDCSDLKASALGARVCRGSPELYIDLPLEDVAFYFNGADRLQAIVMRFDEAFESSYRHFLFATYTPAGGEHESFWRTADGVLAIGAGPSGTPMRTLSYQSEDLVRRRALTQ